MTLSARCPGCGATLPVPSGYTGHAIRCGRCRVVVPLSPPAPPPPVAPRAEPRPARRVRPPDDEPAGRRGPAGRSAPARVALLVGGFGLAGLLLVGCFGGVFYFLLPDGSDGGTVAVGGGGAPVGGGGPPADVRPEVPVVEAPAASEDGWERKLVPGTVLTVEVPTARPGAVRAGQNPYPAMGLSGLYVEQEGPSGTVRFLAGPSLANEPNAPPSLEKKVQGSRELGPDGRVKRSFTILGRPAVIATGRDWTGLGEEESVILFVQVNGFVVSFTVIGAGLDETHPDVKRFFDSVRFGH